MMHPPESDGCEIRPPQAAGEFEAESRKGTCLVKGGPAEQPKISVVPKAGTSWPTASSVGNHDRSAQLDKHGHPERTWQSTIRKQLRLSSVNSASAWSSRAAIPTALEPIAAPRRTWRSVRGLSINW